MANSFLLFNTVLCNIVHSYASDTEVKVTCYFCPLQCTVLKTLTMSLNHIGIIFVYFLHFRPKVFGHLVIQLFPGQL